MAYGSLKQARKSPVLRLQIADCGVVVEAPDLVPPLRDEFANCGLSIIYLPDPISPLLYLVRLLFQWPQSSLSSPLLRLVLRPPPILPAIHPTFAAPKPLLHRPYPHHPPLQPYRVFPVGMERAVTLVFVERAAVL